MCASFEVESLTVVKTVANLAESFSSWCFFQTLSSFEKISEFFPLKLPPDALPTTVAWVVKTIGNCFSR